MEGKKVVFEDLVVTENLRGKQISRNYLKLPWNTENLTNTAEWFSGAQLE
jgi:hypothetical protein